MKKIDTRITKSKEAFHKAFFELLQDYDFEEMTITIICQKADVNRGTFYRHYATKDDLFNEIISMISSDIVQAYYEPYEINPQLTLETIDHRTIRIFQHIYSYKEFYSIVFKRDSSIKLHTIFYDQMKELILDMLFTRNEIENVNYDLLASYKTYAIIGMIIEWVRKDFSYSIDYMNEQLSKIMQVTENS